MYPDASHPLARTWRSREERLPPNWAWASSLWAPTKLPVSPGGHEAAGQYGVSESCLVHGATEEEKACGIDPLACKDRVMLGRWSSRINQVVYGWKACTREFSSSLYLLSFKTTVQSGYYKNEFKKRPLPWGLSVPSLCVCLCRVCLPRGHDTMLVKSRENFLAHFVGFGSWAVQGGHLHLDNKYFLLLWKWIKLWSFIQIILWRFSHVKSFLHYLNRWWQQNQEFIQRYSYSKMSS